MVQVLQSKAKHHMQTEVSIEGAPEMDVDPQQ